MSNQVGSITYDVSIDAAEAIRNSRAMERNLRSMGDEGNRLGTRLTATAGAVRQLGEEASRSGAAFMSLGRVIGAYITARTFQAIIGMSDQYGQMASRIRNATGSTEEYNAVQERLLQTANGTYRSLSEAQEVYLSTERTLKNLGYSTAEVLDITDSFSYALVRDAARADQATTAMDAYSKALMKGRVEADGWASMMAALPSIVRGIADATGETEARILELGANGRLAVGALNEGLRSSLEENKRMADQMTVSVQDAGVKLRNALTLFIGKVNESSGASNVLTENVSALADALQDPQTIAAAQELAAGVVTALRTIITGTREVVGFVRWMGESFAAAVNGIASDDIVRLENRAEALRTLLKGWDNSVIGRGMWSRGTEQELKTIEGQIKAFYAGAGKLAGAAPPPEPKAGNTEPPRPIGKVRAEAEPTRTSRKAASSFDAAGYMAALSSSVADEMTRIDIAEQEALRRNDKLVLSADERARAVTLIEKKAAQDRAAIAEAANAKTLDAARALATEEETIARESAERVARARIAAEDILAENDPAEQIRLRHERLGAELAAQRDKMQANDLEGRQRHAEALLANEQALNDALRNLANRRVADERAAQAMLLGATGDFFGSAAELMKQAAGEQSGVYRVMFAAAKGFNVAQATLNVFAAAAHAMNAQDSITTTQKFANYAAVMAAGGQLISSISSINYGGGRQYGGPVSAGSLYRVNETGQPEMYVGSGGRQYMLPTQSGRVVPADEVGGGRASVTVIVENYGGERVDVRHGSDESTVRVIVGRAKAEIAEEIAANRGQVWRSLVGASTVRPKL